ncbi:MAG: cupin domain-containing protein [Campylobacterales bacterium]|nr:cupin domain-containing protein [Campylobacterales bacterium]
MTKVSFFENIYFDATPQITKMLETPTSKEIRICMAKGNIMKEHTAPGAITIMVLSGEVNIGSNDKNITVQDGEMIYFDAKVPHSLEAKEESIIRLTLSKNDTAQRVLNLAKL